MTIEITPEEDLGYYLAPLVQSLSQYAEARVAFAKREAVVQHGRDVAALLEQIANALIDPEVDVVFVPRSNRPAENPIVSIDPEESPLHSRPRLTVSYPENLRDQRCAEGTLALAVETGQNYQRVGDGWSFHSGPVTPGTLSVIGINQ